MSHFFEDASSRPYKAILDLGGLNQENVNFLGRLGCRIHALDLLSDFDQFKQTLHRGDFDATAAEQFIHQHLRFESGQFDAILAWDTLEYLDVELLSNMIPWLNYILAPGGGLLTTPIDLARFGSAHLKPGYLRAETLELLFTAQRTRSGEVTPYGMNWFIDTDPEGRPVVHHAGESVGGASFVLLYPAEGVVVALQCNLTRANYDDLHFQIGDLFIER